MPRCYCCSLPVRYRQLLVVFPATVEWHGGCRIPMPLSPYHSLFSVVSREMAAHLLVKASSVPVVCCFLEDTPATAVATVVLLLQKEGLPLGWPPQVHPPESTLLVSM